MDKESLFTARWHLNKGYVVPEGEPRDAALAAITAALGVPPPGASSGEAPAHETGPIRISQETWLAGTGVFPVIWAPLTAEEFPRYLSSLPDMGAAAWGWSPTGVTLHHMAEPSLAQRPLGILPEHGRNLRDYYVGLGWKSGPHLFVDEDQVWLFSPLTSRGVHAVSFNGGRIGIEMLGDYDNEDPWTGRGLRVVTMAARAIAALCQRFGWVPDGGTVSFHRDDPKTTKTCPGRRILKDLFLTKVREW